MIESILLYAINHPVEISALLGIYIWSIFFGWKQPSIVEHIVRGKGNCFSPEEEREARQGATIVKWMLITNGIVGIIAMVAGMSGIVALYNPATIITTIIGVIGVLLAIA